MGLDRRPLTPEERSVYEWQLAVSGFGEAGQEKLKAATVLVTRIGGVGGGAAYALAAAGIGKLVIAHGGNVRPSDLNRQLLMTADGVGKPRVASASHRLRELNPRLEVETIEENISDANVERLVRSVDLVIDAAPLFKERFLLNREAVRQGKPMVDAAMFDFEAQLTTIVPGKGPCLACLYPADPPAWKRQFPVFGAVANLAGNLAAIESIKVLAGIGEPLVGRLLVADLREMTFRTIRVNRNPGCAVCR